MCRMFEVTRSGYYAWRNREQSLRDKRRAERVEQVRMAYEKSGKRYGSPRVCEALRIQGVVCNLKAVAKIMKEEGISPKTGRKFVPVTTDSAHGLPIAPNLLGRRFEQAKTDAVWVTDITYIPTRQGWLYLAAVMDLCSRRIVGWAMMDHMESSLVLAALEMALESRRPAAGLMVHSDRGSQYASDDYQGLLARHALVCSMSGKGDCYDNAAMESCWSTIKRELADRENYATREEARMSLFEYIEVFYNRTRLHSSLGFVSPEMFEARLAA
jgi:putative transposase